MSGPGKGRRRRVVVLLIVAGSLYAIARRTGDSDRAADAALRVAELPARTAGLVRQALLEPLGEIFRREGLHGRIAELEARLALADAENQRLREAARENRRLEALLAMREEAGLGGAGARIIATGPGPLRSVIIDRGAADGVVADAPVLAGGGVVGRVIAVGPATAVVQLLIDPASGMAAIAERSRVQGVVVGTGDDLNLRYVPNLEDVQAGDRILTSGLDGIYPAGLVIGTVSEASLGRDAFKAVAIEPQVSLIRLETVLVLDGAGDHHGDRLAQAFAGDGAGEAAP